MAEAQAEEEGSDGGAMVQRGITVFYCFLSISSVERQSRCE